jgi:molecular chaperone IbpA
MAVAGFGDGDLDIVVHDNMLSVKGQLKDLPKEVEYLHRGIAQRAFEHRFQLADHVRVVTAQLVNGLLDIDLERVVPEEKKPRKVEISAAGAPRTIEGKAA